MSLIWTRFQLPFCAKSCRFFTELVHFGHVKAPWSKSESHSIEQLRVTISNIQISISQKINNKNQEQKLFRQSSINMPPNFLKNSTQLKAKKQLSSLISVPWSKIIVGAHIMCHSMLLVLTCHAHGCWGSFIVWLCL